MESNASRAERPAAGPSTRCQWLHSSNPSDTGANSGSKSTPGALKERQDDYTSTVKDLPIHYCSPKSMLEKPHLLENGQKPAPQGYLASYRSVPLYLRI